MIKPEIITSHNRNLDFGNKPSLSIIIPCYNEEKTLNTIIDKVLPLKQQINLIQIIIVDDCSKDKSAQIITKISNENNLIEYKSHEKNIGKGAAIHTGIKFAKADYIVIQDADDEYNPDELVNLYNKIITENADAVFGSRFLNKNYKQGYTAHFLANKFLTAFTNLFIHTKITDMETCYKMVKSDLLKRINFQEQRFGFEPEVTIKLCKLKPKIKIAEIPISYKPRGYDEGKKIGLKDGLRAIYCILKYGFQK